MAYRFHFCLLQHTQIHHSGNQIDVTCEILFFQSIERKTRFRKVSRPNVASNLNQNQHFLPFCQKLDLEEKEEP